jgi:2-oxoglutarate ferredoxin oxidoreductase subunit delta
VAFCPRKALEMDLEDKVYMKYPEKCIFCKLCEIRCPDLVLEVTETEEGAVAKSADGSGSSRPAKTENKA